MNISYSLSKWFQLKPASVVKHSSMVVAAIAIQFTALNAQAKEERIQSALGDVVVKHNIQRGTRGLQKAEEADPFATREQRERIAPMEWIDDSPITKQEMDTIEQNLPAGSATGGLPQMGANELARMQFRDAWEYIEQREREEAESLSSPIDTFDGTHGIFTRYRGNYHSQFWKYAPFNKIGKLYFTTPNGGSSYCTANLITNKAHIVTAAHCIYSRGQGFNRNFKFVPADRYGAAPYGSYGWSSATVLSDWINVGDRKSDVGLIKLRNDSAGKPASDYVGWLGRSWNHGYTQHMHSFGYASNLSTQYTHICAAQSFYSGTEGTDVLVKGCDMTYGSSGGGWLRLFTPYSHGGNYVNGVVSGPHIGGFGNTYVGPRFSSYNIVALCNTQGC